MQRIAPTDWRTLEKIFLADGWRFKRHQGSHRVYIKAGFLRPLIIPTYSEVGVDIIQGNMRTAQMSRERYLHLLTIV